VILSGGTTTAAVIGSLGTVLAGLLAFLGAWATLRSARRMRAQSDSVDQRKLDQAAFDKFTRRYDTEREEQQLRMRQSEEETARARRETERTKEALRTLWDHVLDLRAVMREHNITPPPPPRIALYPWEGFRQEEEGGGNGHVR